MFQSIKVETSEVGVSTFGLRPNVVTLTSQCRTPAQSSWKSTTFFVYDLNKSTLTSSNDPNKSTQALTSPGVLHTFSSTINMEKKEKLELGMKLGNEIK